MKQQQASEKMERIFKTSKGARIDKNKVQEYGEYLWKLKEYNGDVLTPEYIVEQSKQKSSPLYEYFEWDNKIAGDKYRLWQARYLIARIEIIVKYDDGTEAQMRAFHNIIVQYENEDDEQGYVTVQDLKENPDYLLIILEKATHEIIAWKERYAKYHKLQTFKPLKSIFKAIKGIEKEVRV